jgi:hypothetical protein
VCIKAGYPKFVREIIAKRIVTLGARGERDPERLCQAALSGFALADKRASRPWSCPSH